MQSKVDARLGRDCTLSVKAQRLHAGVGYARNKLNLSARHHSRKHLQGSRGSVL